MLVRVFNLRSNKLLTRMAAERIKYDKMFLESLRVTMETERFKLNQVFGDWNHKVYQAVELTFENQRKAYDKEFDAKDQRCAELEKQVADLSRQRKAYDKEFDAKNQRCAELEKQVADLSRQMQDKRIGSQGGALEKDKAVTEMLMRVSMLEGDVQVVKEIYKKTLDTTNEMQERMETRLDQVLLKQEPEEENEDVTEFTLMNRLELLRSAKAKSDVDELD